MTVAEGRGPLKVRHPAAGAAWGPPPIPPSCGSAREGLTLIELIVVIMLISLLAAFGIGHFRNTRVAATRMTSAITGQIEARRASDALKDILVDASEIVKPAEGSTQNFLVVKDIINQIRAIYLEKPVSEAEGPFQLVTYLDTFSGGYVLKNRKVLVTKVKEVAFTSLAPGLVVIQLTLIDAKKAETTVLLESTLKNLGSQPDE